MTHSLITIVDENDAVIGRASKQEAWEKGLWHRLVRVLVEDNAGRLLLQKRAANLALYPNRWDLSVAGHVDADESYEAAAHRELGEELGITNAILQEIDAYKTSKMFEGRQLNRFNKTFCCVLAEPPTAFKLQAEEVAEVRWFTPGEVRQLFHDDPEKVTDGLRRTVERRY